MRHCPPLAEIRELSGRRGPLFRRDSLRTLSRRRISRGGQANQDYRTTGPSRQFHPWKAVALRRRRELSLPVRARRVRSSAGTISHRKEYSGHQALQLVRATFARRGTACRCKMKRSPRSLKCRLRLRIQRYIPLILLFPNKPRRALIHASSKSPAQRFKLARALINGGRKLRE